MQNQKQEHICIPCKLWSLINVCTKFAFQLPVDDSRGRYVGMVLVMLLLFEMSQ